MQVVFPIRYCTSLAMKKIWTWFKGVLSIADSSATIQTAKRGVDLASNAVDTGARAVRWLWIAALSFVVMLVLLIADISVHIIK